MKTTLHFNSFLFPFKYLRPKEIDALLFYRFCLSAYIACIIAEIATTIALSTQQLEQSQFVRSAFEVIPFATSATMAPLLLFSIHGFFRQVDYQEYVPFHWNPNPRYRHTGAAIRASLACTAISLLVLLFPKGLFLLLIDEYHAIAPTYAVCFVFAAVVAYISPIMACVLLISATALITLTLKALQPRRD